MFSDEEAAQIKVEEEQAKLRAQEKANNGFFKDGATRVVVIDGIIKEQKESQRTGKPYTLSTYQVRDVSTGETYQLIDRNFAFSNAFGPIKRDYATVLTHGSSQLSVRASKVSEREYKGVTYPEFAYEMVYLGEGTAAASTETPAPPIDPNVSEPKTDGIPF